MSSKILLLDIETAPTQAFVWRLFRENVAVDQIIRPSRVICWASKWYGKAGVDFYSEWDHGHASMIRAMRDKLAEADAVVTYNGDKFDLPKLMGEFAVMGLDSPGPLTSIDLYRTVRRLGLVSNKLEFAAPYLGVGEKLKHEGFRLWRLVEEGDEKARRKMERYNRQDTVLLEKLYRNLRPYIKNHPYLGAIKIRCCPTCGSRKVQKRGTRRTKSFFIERLHCQACGAWGDGVRTKVTQ